MIIIDTNVIIDFLNNRQNEKIDIFCQLLQSKEDIGINTLIYFEIWLGNKPKKEIDKINNLLKDIGVI